MIINPVRINREKWRGEQYFVAIVTIITIVLWCVEAQLKDIVGDMGIIAIFPIVAFYGSGVLRKVHRLLISSLPYKLSKFILMQ